MRNVRLVHVGWHAGRAVIAGALCFLLVEQPLSAEAPIPAPVKQIQGQQRIVHALNRLTFGPRPGDLAAVQKMGLEAWFEGQLQPERLGEDSQLNAKLAEFPAMKLSVEELQARYPAPQTIRGMAAGRLALPSDPTLRVLAEDQIAFYNMQREKQATKLVLVAPQTATDSAAPDSAMKRAADDIGDESKTIAAGQQALDDEDLAAANRMPQPEVAAVLQLAPDARMQAILAMKPSEVIRFRQGIRPVQLPQLVAGMSPMQKEILTSLGGSGRMVALEALQSRLLRDLYSDRQLEAVMTDFWLNHFNVYLRKNQNEPYLIPTYERETIRPRALGNFEDLLVATARSPAMLEYLDNFRSVGPNSPQVDRARRLEQTRPGSPAGKQASAGLNENYGRELMELHTLGVAGGYTQADVTNVAKVFTGWGLDKPSQAGGIAGTFVFDERRHEPGNKQVLGKTIHEDGMKEGLAVLHMLATSPATARFISEKLAERFVSDTPPQALVERLAASFTASHGDIKTVLRTMFHSPEFWSPDVYRAKVKTPEEFVVSAVRASGAEVTNAVPLVQSLEKLGMPLYGMQTPNGYSWKEDGWVGTGALVNRMNFSLVLAGGRVPGTQISWDVLLAGPERKGVVSASDTAEGKAAADELKLEAVLLGVPVSDRTRATVLLQSSSTTVAEQAETQFNLNAAGVKAQVAPTRQGGHAALIPNDAQTAVMAGLLLGSPEFQRR